MEKITIEIDSKYPNEYIDLSHQQCYNVQQFRDCLICLRNMIRELALTASREVWVSDYEENQQILNWMIEEIELRD